MTMSEKNGVQVLEIHEVNRDDVGVYTCMVVNGSGKASMSAELSIQGSRLGAGRGQDSPFPGGPPRPPGRSCLLITRFCVTCVTLRYS